MNEFDLKQYIDISNFLGTLLGPDYEIILYDMKHIVHIVNGDISGRHSGEALSPTIKTILHQKRQPMKNGCPIIVHCLLTARFSDVPHSI